MSFRTPTRRAIRAAAFAAGVLALAAHAADPPKAPAKGKSKSLLLSREELRACMATKDRMQQQRDEITQLQAQLEALDRTNVELVQKHVDASNARDRRIDAYEAKATAFNAKVEALRNDQAAYTRDCENKRFDTDDEAAIKKAK
jgi:hypothetical protein